MSYNRTVTEFSGRRKLIYGDKTEEKSVVPNNAASISFDPSFSTHKTFYEKDINTGFESYFIEFNIGNFNFDEITIKTEGNKIK